MAINFIPNDPLSLADFPLRSVTPRKARPKKRAGINVANPVDADKYAMGSAEFLHWQAREAALWAIEVWEKLGGKLANWAQQATNPKLLDLHPDRGEDLNAYYDRDSLSFYHAIDGSKTTFSGASVDVVAHEMGHALLDSIRPDLWASPTLEIASFHEAFGDCMALLTALSDAKIRASALASAGSAGPVETLMEDLADGAKRAYGAAHPAAGPRQAFNKRKWQLPAALPFTGGPDILIAEAHSFSTVFTGCFYDCIVGIYERLGTTPAKASANWWKAAQIAGKLLIIAVGKAAETPQFYQSVGQEMVRADVEKNGGANAVAIADAFKRHNVQVAADVKTPAARSVLEGPPPPTGRGAMAPVAPVTRNDILTRIGAGPGAKVDTENMKIGGVAVTKLVHHREVPLDHIDPRLAGVVAVAPEPILIGRASGQRAALFSALPEARTTSGEVTAFVEGLLRNGQLDLGGQAAAQPARPASPPRGRGAVAGGGGGVAPIPKMGLPTHTIRNRAGTRVLERVRFACRCGCPKCR